MGYKDKIVVFPGVLESLCCVSIHEQLPSKASVKTENAATDRRCHKMLLQ